MIGANDCPLAPGQWDAGQNDDGTERMNGLLGRIFCMHLRDFVGNAGSPVKGRQVGPETYVALVRNKTGVSLSASDVVKMDDTTPAVDASGNLATGGNALVPALAHVGALAGAATDILCGVVDPALTSDVPDEGIFLLLVRGPALARLPATSPTITAGATWLAPASSGVVGVEAGTSMERATLGIALQTRATPTHDGGLVLLNLTGAGWAC